MNTCLLVIDIQNDYFPGGNYPLWNADVTLDNVVQAITQAHVKGLQVVLVQHIANPENGISPFFNEGTEGVELHPRIRATAPDAPVIVKRYADSFHKTTLEEILTEKGIANLLVCGMMTQNCVTHTAISKAAEKYAVTILTDCCTTVDPMIHAIALNAVAPRLPLAEASDAINGAA